MERENELRPIVKIRLACEQVCYGPGTQQLLTLIKKTGSVHLACEEMGMSYSKAWKMIRLMEQQFGYAVVLRRQGGRHGGSSSLTPEGEALAEHYRAFVEECGKQVEESFRRHFSEQREENSL